MTDNEIIKALECCGELFPNPCSQCPYLNTTPCVQLKRDVLDLINRQKAEIEKYKAEHHSFCVRVGKLSKIEMMVFERHNELKAEAIKEFAEMLKDYHKNYEGFCFVDDDDIDNLVAEMTEGRENDN